MNYRDNLQHKEKVKQSSKRQYCKSLRHNQQVLTSVRLSRKQKLEKSAGFGFVKDQFLEKVRDGPYFVCCVCHRLLFKYQMLKRDWEVYATTLATAGIGKNCIGELYLHRCDEDCVVPCQLFECRGQLCICYTCHGKITKGEIPAEC